MKKLLVAVLAFALFAPAFAVENVQLTGDIQSIGASIEDRGTTLTNPAGDNYKGITNRVILGFGADLVDDVYAKVTLAHRWVAGDNGLTGATVTGATGLLDTTFVAEAFVKVSNIFDALEVKVGRQYYGDVNSAVMYFGPDYGYVSNAYTSLDGVTAKYNGDNFALTAAYFTVANAVVAPATLPVRGDVADIAGLDLDVKINENIKASAYIYDVKTDNVPTFLDSFGFWGVKPTLEYEHFKLGVDFARNYGAGNDKGWQVKADLALPIGTDETSVTPRVTYLKSEKNFQAFGNYRPGLMFGTIMAVQGIGPVNNYLFIYAAGALANWEILNAGLCMKFAGLEKVGFGLDFYTGEMNGAFVGNSWEVKAVYNVNQYVNLNLTGAMLTNRGHSWKHSPTAVQLGMNVKF